MFEVKIDQENRHYLHIYPSTHPYMERDSAL